ncbi:MAG: DUF2764 family protein [Candidatus Omnitrophota bacterium]|nr:DUF2764 family protein [Candidatus Omnitrophota bacterium]
MSSHYPYLVASLPMLHFGMKPPFSLEKFLRDCRDLIPEKDYAVLIALPDAGSCGREFTAHPVIKAYLSYEASLRNAVLRVRASRRHIDPARYLRADGDFGAALEHLALASHRHPSLLEAEQMLDSARWQALEHLSFGHYFDLGVLIIYAYKLIILERWEKIRAADKENLLEAALSNA